MSTFYQDENKEFIFCSNANLLLTQLNNRIVQQLLETETSNTLSHSVRSTHMCMRIEHIYVDVD